MPRTTRSPRRPATSTTRRTCTSRAYDLVLDGAEIGGGSIRINRIEVQQKVFELLGIGPEEAQARFGFLLDALRYGAPPHGGIAMGIDRIVTALAGVENDPRRDRVPEGRQRHRSAHRRARPGRPDAAARARPQALLNDPASVCPFPSSGAQKRPQAAEQGLRWQVCRDQ